MAPRNPALAGWGPFNPHWRLQVDRFQRDIVYRRPSTRRHSILRYITRVAAFPGAECESANFAPAPRLSRRPESVIVLVCACACHFLP